jgi:hypothetical protein
MALVIRQRSEPLAKPCFASGIIRRMNGVGFISKNAFI